VTDDGVIVPLGPAHAAVLAAIHEAAFPPAERWGPEAIALQLGLPGYHGLYHPAGGMVLLRAAADEAEILTLAVVPAARRQGVGAGLLGAAMRAAAAHGARALFLEVATTNRPALSLYRRLGFAEVGRRSRYYADGADALVMKARLCHPGGSRDA